MRDLWNELARRARQAAPPQGPDMPFGFEQTVLARTRTAGRERPNAWESWIPLLRPALGLAFGAAMICVVFDYRGEQALPANLVSQTEALLQYASFNE